MPGYYKLSGTKVSKVRRPGRYGDGLGLWLQVSRWKNKINKSWLFQFTAPRGKVRQLGLGPLHTVSLAKARERAAEARLQVLDGIDPIEVQKARREQARLEQAKRVTFRECAEKYIGAHQGAWRNAKHLEQWGVTLKTYVYPVFGDLSVAAIDTALVLKALEPIWASKPETAGRLRGRIERVLDFAKTRHYRDGENPGRWKGHLDNLLPKVSKIKNVRHHPALDYKDLPAFMAELRSRGGISASALEVTVLTALRTTEVIKAKWSEIDLHAKLWTVPPERMKSGKEHRVPLSDRAIEVLGGLPHEHGSQFVFVGGKEGAPLSAMAMLQLLRGMRPGLTVHGFRSSFRDWAAESTNYPNHVIEMALAHSIGDKVEAAYRRGDLFEKRRRLMAEWAKYCTQKPVASKTDNVTRLRAPKVAS